MKTETKPQPARKASPPAENAAPERPPWGRHAHWQLSAALAVVWLIIDQLTKIWAVNVLRPEWWRQITPTAQMIEAMPVIQIIPGFLRLVYADNEGAAFSMFHGYPTALGFVSLAAAAALIVFWWSMPAREVWGRAAVALVFSGAIGNMIDRFSRGHVVDFIDAYAGSYHWPTFNIADSCICVGAGILVVRFLKGAI